MKFCNAIMLGMLCQTSASALKAVTTVLFDITQNIELTAEGTTSDTYTTRGYVIEVTRDKLFTGGVGLTEPIGRSIRVPWPDGMEAQAVTSGPNPGKANLSIRRVDGQAFAVTAFTVKLLANTYGAGGSIEVMPLIQGEDALPDPVAFDVTGFYSMSYPFTTSQFTGHNYDSYKFTLYVDYALTSLVLIDASPPPPPAPIPAITRVSAANSKISWPVNGYEYTLLTCTDLQNGVWTANFGQTTVEGDFNIVNFNPSDTCRFFRLTD